MAAVPEQRRRATSPREQEGDRRHVTLRRVALRACQHEVVATVVGRLAPSWRHVIQRHHRRRERSLAVRAHGTVFGQKPAPRLRVRSSMRRRGCQAGGRRLRPVGTRAPRPALACRYLVRDGLWSLSPCGAGTCGRPLTRFPPAASAGTSRRPPRFARATRVAARVAPRRHRRSRVARRVSGSGITCRRVISGFSRRCASLPGPGRGIAAPAFGGS